MSDYSVRIVNLAADDSFIILKHARIRMFERNISTDDMIVLVKSGEIIEQYPDDEPYPSVLIHGYIIQSPLPLSSRNL